MQDCHHQIAFMNKTLIAVLLTLLISTIGWAQISELEKIAMPVLYIETVDGVMPTCTVVHAPEGCIGTSITDNQYVPGRMVMKIKGDTLYDTKEYVKDTSGMRIKIRGNSTGANLNQHPYKIKLSKKYDLLERQDAGYKHKEWLLLSMYTWNPTMTNQESNILHMAGLAVSRIFHKEWTPEYRLVQVMLNGAYQGMYYLMEAVARGDKRIPLTKDGFLIENDPFWWNEDAYFRTHYQPYSYAYTYKYPDSDDVTEEVQNNILSYLNSAENAIYQSNNIEAYLDMESFARWILIHDFLGTDDAAGCNRFLSRYDNTSLLQMGPTWDYDSAFKCEGWSNLHYYESFYYPELFKNDDFVAQYTGIWKTVRPTIYEAIDAELDAAWNLYADVFDAGMKIHQTKYTYEGQLGFQAQIEEVRNKLYERVGIMNQLMEQNYQVSGIQTLRQQEEGRQHIVSDLQGRKRQVSQLQTTKNIYILNGKKYIQ